MQQVRDDVLTLASSTAGYVVRGERNRLASTAPTITTKPTLFRPTRIGIRSTKRSDYRACVNLGSRSEWEPMSSSLDWSVVDGLDDFLIRARYAEYIETRQQSEHASYDGRRDYRRVPNGRGFGRTVCKVQRGRGDHVVRIRYANGFVTKRLIPESEVIPTVRLFLSAQYVSRGLDMLVAEFEQLGANITKDAIRMVIRPVKN